MSRVSPDSISIVDQVYDKILADIINENIPHRTCANKLFDEIVNQKMNYAKIYMTTGLSDRTISRLGEYGYHADMTTIVRVAKAVGWTIDDLQYNLSQDGKAIGYTARDRAYRYYLCNNEMDWHHLLELVKKIKNAK